MTIPRLFLQYHKYYIVRQYSLFYTKSLQIKLGDHNFPEIINEKNHFPFHFPCNYKDFIRILLLLKKKNHFISKILIKFKARIPQGNLRSKMDMANNSLIHQERLKKYLKGICCINCCILTIHRYN